MLMQRRTSSYVLGNSLLIAFSLWACHSQARVPDVSAGCGLRARVPLDTAAFEPKNYHDMSPRQETDLGLMALNELVEDYMLANHCKLPEALSQLVLYDPLLRSTVDTTQLYVDAWGHRFHYRRRGDTVTISSDGADGVSGSFDDQVLTKVRVNP